MRGNCLRKYEDFLYQLLAIPFDFLEIAKKKSIFELNVYIKIQTSLSQIYSKEQNTPLICLLMKSNEHFLREHGAYKITATPMPSWGFRLLLRPFKWGTVWCFITRGIKTASSQN